MKIINKAALIVFGCIIMISCKDNDNATTIKPQMQNVAENQKAGDTCVTFFDKFPSTFATFSDAYGYDAEKGKRPLYDRHQEDISYFFNCPGVSEDVRLKKAIHICLGGSWDADAIGIFQKETMKLIKSSPKKAMDILNGLSDPDAASIWHFLFDGPHPDSDENIKDVKQLSALFGNDNKQTLLLKKEYEKLLKEEKH
jgi:hypothetical protein